MSWTQADISFKTLLNKRQSDSNKQFYEEFGDYTINTHIGETWYNSIPSDSSTLAGVTLWYASHTMKLDTTVANSLTWAAVTTPGNSFNFALSDDPTNPRLKDWISDKYGLGYDLKLYANGVQIAKTSTVYPWRFNYATGELTFNTLAPATPITIQGYRYVGKKGLDTVFLKEVSLGYGFNWNAGVLNVSSNGDVTKLYVDGSLSARDLSINQLYLLSNSYNSSIGWLALRVNVLDSSLYSVTQLVNALNASMGGGLGAYATNSSVNLAFYSNVSLGLAFNQYTNVSLGLVSANYATNASVNTAITNAFASNASLGYASSLVTALNSSIGNYALSSQLSKTDTSLYNTNQLVSVLNTSMGVGFGAYATNASVGLAFLTNASLGLANNIVTNVSLGVLSQKMVVDNASIGQLTLLTSALNTSMGAGLGTYATNASVNTAITNAFASNSSLGYASSLAAALNSSIGNYALTSQLTKTDTSLYNISLLTSALNTSMGSGLGAYATNASVNLAFYSNASLGLANNIVTNVSLGVLSQKMVVDNASIGQLTLLTSALNTSMGSGLGSYATNASVNLAFASNSSLGNISLLTYAWNSSISSYTTKTYVDACINTEKQKWIDINRTGFINEEDVSLSFNPSTYVLTLHKVNPTWTYMRQGIEYTFSNDVSIQIANPPSKGIYYVVIDNNNGTLSSSQTGWTLLDSTLPVASITWDASLNPTYLFAEEKHQSLMDRRTHAYLHFTIGTRFMNGGVLTGPTVGPNNSNQAVTFGVSETRIADEDMFETLPAFLRPDGSSLAYSCFYRTNASTWSWVDSSVPYTYGPNNRIYYDNGSGVMTEAPNTINRWYNWYLLFTNLYGRGRYAMIPGRNSYTSLTAAQAEDPRGFDMTGFPIVESVIAYQMTWQYLNTNTNLGKVYLAATPAKINAATITSVGTASGYDHNSLAGLQGGASGEYYHLTAPQYDLYNSLTTNTSVGLAFSSNASLGNVSQLTYAHNASISSLTTQLGKTDTSLYNVSQLVNALNTSMGSGFGAFATNASVNLALFSNASLGLSFNQYTNVSLGLAFSQYANASLGLANNIVTNVSLGVLSQKMVVDNASIGQLTLLTSALNTSMGSGLGAYATNASVNLAFYSNASLGLAFNQYTNASLGLANNIVTNVSLGVLSQKMVVDNVSIGQLTLLTSALNTSMGAGLTTYATNASVNLAFYSNSSLGSISQLTYAINASLNTYDLKTFATNTSVGLAITNAFASNASLGAATQLAYALNTSIGNYALTSQLTITDTSLFIVKATYIPEVSLNVNKFKWSSGLLEPSLATTGVSVEYVDGSLAARDASMNDIVDGYGIFIPEVSLNYSKFKWSSGLLEPSVAGSSDVTKEYVDGSIANFATNASVNLAFYSNSSLGNISQLTYAHNASIGILTTQLGKTDTSLYNTKLFTGVLNTSIGALNASLNDTIDAFGLFIPEVSLNDSYFIWSSGYLQTSTNSYATNASVNLAFYSNASLGLVFSQYANASLGLANNIVTNVSLGILSQKMVVDNASIGALNASLNDVFFLSSYVNTSEYYDGSINNIRVTYASNASVNLAFLTNVSLGLAFNQYSNASLGLANNSYATNASVNLAFLTNPSLGASFNPYTNVSLGLAFDKYSNASLGLAGTAGATTLAALTDVSITSIANNDLLKYDSSFSKWMNIAPVDACSYFYTKTQIDASFATNVSVNLAFLTNPSLGLAFNQYSNASLGLAGSGGLSRAQADASFATNASVNLAFITNVSLGLAFNQYTNVSLGLAGVAGLSRADIDASFATNASVNLAFLTNPSLGAAFNPYTNVSLGLANNSYATNASVNLAFLTNPSLGAAFNPYTNVSLGLAFDKYSNASLGLAGTAGATTLSALTDVSITSIANNDLLKYDSSFGKWMNIAPVDACSYFYTKAQIDASFATNASVNLAFYSNASLGLANNIVTNVSLGVLSQKMVVDNASIGALNASLNDVFFLSSYVNTSEYYDGSINNIRNLYATNASVNLAFYSNVSLGVVSQKMIVDNVSIGRLNASLNDTIDAFGLFIPEVSLNDSYFIWSSGYLQTSTNSYATNASVNLSLYSNASLGLANNIVTNVSLGVLSAKMVIDNASIGAINASINDIVDGYGIFIPEVSLNENKFKWSSGLLEPSIAGSADVTKEYVDGSIANFATNASVNYAFASNASLGGASFDPYSNASLGLAFSQYTNVSLGLAFDQYTNVSLGLAGASGLSRSDIDASFATNASVNLGFVPYTGAKTDISINSKSITQVNGIQFNTAPLGVSSIPGQLYYDNSNNTLALNLGVKGVTLQIGQETYVYGYNYTTSTITNGQVVYVAGASNNFPTFALAKADNIITARVTGVATQDISIGYLGYVTRTGIIHSVSTNTFNSGDVLYLSGTTAGALANTIQATDFDIKVGHALNSSTNGAILVYPENEIEIFATNASVGRAFNTNASLGLAFSRFSNASLGLAFSQYSNASLGVTSQKMVVDNASIGVLTSRMNISDTSMYGMYSNARIDASFATNASVNTAISRIDSSVSSLWYDVNVDSSRGTNLWVSGITTRFTANVNASFGDVGYVLASGRIALGNASAIATSNAVVMCADTSILAATAGNWLMYGSATATAWNWTTGGLIYLSTTGTNGNTLTQTAPSGANNVIQILGVATSKNSMLFTPSLVQVEHT